MRFMMLFILSLFGACLAQAESINLMPSSPLDTDIIAPAPVNPGFTLSPLSGQIQNRVVPFHYTTCVWICQQGALSLLQDGSSFKLSQDNGSTFALETFYYQLLAFGPDEATVMAVLTLEGLKTGGQIVSTDIELDLAAYSTNDFAFSQHNSGLELFVGLKALTFSVAMSGFNVQPAQLNISDILVGVNAVPIPATVWLFCSALAGLGWMRRKQTVSV
jgi:hypothetical protein